MNNNSEFFKNRRSVRKYKLDKSVSREQLDFLLEAAMLAPSACNSRPWEFIAVTDRQIIDKLAIVHPSAKMCETATAVIVVVAIPQSGKPEGYFPQDCAAATQNILLAAAQIGLGTCWCGVYPKEDRTASMAELFDIRAPKIPFCIIAVGTPDENPPQRGFFESEKVRYI